MEKNGETKPILLDGGSLLSTLPERERRGWTLNLLLSASVAVIGSSFQFGYNSGVINAPGRAIQQFINETSFDRYGSYVGAVQLKVLWGVTVSIFAVGGMIGSFAAGYLATRFGRKRTMLSNNVLVLIAIALMGTAKYASSFEMLIIGRLVIGINCGVNTGLAPLYLTEIAPVNLRGILGISNQLGIVIAILISQILGLSFILGNESDWPLLLMLCGVFALYQLLLFPVCHETPSYLLSRGQEQAAKDALRFLRGHADIDEEIEQLKSEQSQAESQQQVSIVELFKEVDLRKPMIIAIMLQLAQQLSGMVAVLYYSSSIFVSAGIPKKKADLMTVGMGVANIVMTTASLFLIERLGRRILLLVGLAGMCVCSVALVISLTTGVHTSWGPIVAVIAVFLFVIGFQTGPGSIPWFITAELFTESARAAAMSVAGLVNWTGNFAVGLAYPPLQKIIGGYAFIIFACLLAIFWLFTYFRVPETKGRSVEEISRSFRS